MFLLESLFFLSTQRYTHSQFLQKIITNNSPICTSHISNSFDLCKTLSGSKIDNNHILEMTSFDVKNDIKKRWTHIERSTRIPKNEFLTAVRFVLSSTYFTFNNIIYKQTYGTPWDHPYSS